MAPKIYLQKVKRPQRIYKKIYARTEYKLRLKD